MKPLSNIFHLGVKELLSLYRDPAMLVLIVWAFSLGIYVVAISQPESLQKAPIAIVDEDQTMLSARIIDSLYPPYFIQPVMTNLREADFGMDNGRYTFVLNIPSNFQRDVLAQRQPAMQLNADATLVSQAMLGAGYLQSIINGEVNGFVQRYRSVATLPINLEPRTLFNPNLIRSWFSAVMAVINNVTMLSIILTGAALIREREHGTIEHLLVMPLTPFEIMVSKVWAMGLVVLVAAAFGLEVMVKRAVGAVIPGSLPLFLLGVAIYLLATASMGIFLGTIARSMPQFGLLTILTLLPLEILSGSVTPYESMPIFLQKIMLFAPTTHFVSLAQAILYRGAGFDVVWPQFLAILAIASVFFMAALFRFRKSIGEMQV
ncbi:MAG TPA: ABC transporter permease [Pseudacidobacterium sp.]|jgi:ABC-2 type transport system permease protein|nr:ABC transporter permease [Pseudacidobacterium sp.]